MLARQLLRATLATVAASAAVFAASEGGAARGGGGMARRIGSKPQQSHGEVQSLRGLACLVVSFVDGLD